MAHFEVETRAKERAVVPQTLCCACGRGPGDGVMLSGSRLEADGRPVGVSDTSLYRFPLCDGCADAESARDTFLAAGALLGGGAVVLAFAVAWIWGTGGPSGGVVQEAVNLLIFGWMGAMLGMCAGWVLMRLVALVSPRVGWGNRVGGVAWYNYERSPGRTVEGYHFVFRFSSAEYARAFAEANEPILVPPGSQARERAGALGAGSAPESCGSRDGHQRPGTMERS